MVEASGTGDSGDQRGENLCPPATQKGACSTGVEGWRNRLEEERGKAVRQATQGEKNW